AAVSCSAGTKGIANHVPAGTQYYQGGPTVAFADGGRGDSSTAWSTWSPTVSAQFGTITSATVNSARYKQIGKTTFIQLDITINTNGTGSGHVFATLPANGVSGQQQVMTMLETANTGEFGGGFVGVGADIHKASIGFS